MNEDNIPAGPAEQPARHAPEQSAADTATPPAASGTPGAPRAESGHDMPRSFASDSVAPPAQSAPHGFVPPAGSYAPSQPSSHPFDASGAPGMPHGSAQPHAGSPYPGAASGRPSHPMQTPQPHLPAQGAVFGIPAPTHLGGDSPSSPHTTPGYATSGHTTPGHTTTGSQDRKPSGAGRVAALIVAASLVGGLTGLGTSYVGNTVWAQQHGTAAAGPSTVTVNNPGSVNETTAIATEVLPSVVTIQVAGGNQGGSGSGVILSDDGYVLTNTHVVTLGGAVADPSVRVTTSDGRIYDAEVVGTDPIYDLAVIKLQDASDLTPIEFGDSSELNVGSTAVAVGAPLGLSNSVTTGIVSALNRSIEIASSAVPDSADQDAPDDGSGSPYQFDIPGMGAQQATESISISVIQTDAAINPGNSGGALVDSEGRLIGINVAIATAGGAEESGSIGVGFAIPSNVAQRVSDEIIENGSATHGLLGASVRDAASLQGAEVAGAAIVETTRGGGAASAGLREGDIVTEFNGSPITSASDLTAQVRAAAAGSTAQLTYVRDGSSHEIEVELGELSL